MEGFVPIKGFEKTHLINKETQEVYSLIKKRMLKGSLNGGYIAFNLKDKNGKTVVKKLHRLLMETFVPNPNNYPVVNHKDGNKLNNNLDNLEWCTQSYNNKEAYRLGLRKVSEKTREQFLRDCHTPEIKAKAIENLKKSKAKAIAKSKEVNSFKVELIKEGKTLFFDSCSSASEYIKVHKGSVARALRTTGKIKDYTVKKIS